ncbi:YciI family protein [Streptomyces sp. NPDC090025]|uniref:YciI family protein n=1 Tax=Streptomyces sp. NPDC090025 TaxID=3365922 RepID=UPI003838972F
MEFVVIHRDRPGSLPLRDALIEDHWSYMDRFEKELIARGPIFTTDGSTLLGSIHIVDLPGPAAVRAFAFDEPNYQAGAYRDVLVRRWRNLLGRTMWDYPGGRTGGDRFLVLGLGAGEPADQEPPADRTGLIAYGPLLSDDGTAWLGTVALVEAADADTARAVLTADRYDEVEVHGWTFGGRR